MATSTFESFDSDLKVDIEEMPEEVSNAEEDSSELLNCPQLKSHHGLRLS